MKPFNHNRFIGYICEVTPQYVRMQIPSAKLIHTFYLNGEIFHGGSVGSFVVIEGVEFGFLGRVFELNLPQGERLEITDKNINAAAYSYKNSKFFKGSFMDLLLPSIAYGVAMLHYQTICGSLFRNF